MTTYYISPGGNDANNGTAPSTPWLTFNHAIPGLVAGDTLILMDGTYLSTTTGLPSMNIGYAAANGTPLQPITIKAQNERKALLQSASGVPAFYMKNCSYWIAEGLRFQGGDNTYAGAAQFLIESCDHITLRRLLGAYNNRNANNHLLQLAYTTYSLVEECELYYFHRHGMMTYFSDYNTFRRNYIHSRDYPDIPGGYASGAPKGDGGITLYPGHHNLVENNISEDILKGFSVAASYPDLSDNNRFFGNIVLDGQYGSFFAEGRYGNVVKNTQFIDNVVVSNIDGYSNTTIGIYLIDNENTTIDRTSVLINVPSTTVFGVYAVYNAGTPNSAYFTNTHIKTNKGYGFLTSGLATVQFNYTNVYGASSAPWTPSIATNSTQIDPQLGNYIAWIPPTSPMKGVGLGGSDIGANILYRYQDGVLTEQPLWNPTTGEFPHGAIIAGVNDIAGQSAFDVHTRLNVNCNGTTFPPGYGGCPDVIVNDLVFS